MAMTNDFYMQFQRNRVRIQNSGEAAHQDVLSASPTINSNAGYQQYQNNMVNTASPQELTLMLYNGLIKFINLSIQAVEEKNISKAHNNIVRAQDILMEFMSTLDMNYEVSKGLMALYDYMNRRLIEANLNKDRDILKEVLGFAEELRDTWSQAMKLAKQQQNKVVIE